MRETPTNWRRWTEKEQRGVNRGYDNAFINTSRFTNRVFVSELPEYMDYEAKVVVQSGLDNNDGVFNMDAEKEVRRFDSTALAMDEAFDIMEGTQASRDGSKRSAVEVLTDLHEALAEHGLVAQHDANKRGWTKKKGFTGFSLRALSGSPEDYDTIRNPQKADLLWVNLSVDGKESGLSYTESKEVQGEDVITVHDPCRPEKLCSSVRRSLEDVGFSEVHNVRKTGHQTHYDYSTDYSAVVGVPDYLILPEPSHRSSHRTRRF